VVCSAAKLLSEDEVRRIAANEIKAASRNRSIIAQHAATMCTQAEQTAFTVVFEYGAVQDSK
jgi:hypothetical protein